MAFETSPAVERVATAARGWAGRAGSDRVRLGDWLLGLLEDEDGKPAHLLAQTGADPVRIREELAKTDRGPFRPEDELFDAARDRGIALRADPSLTTDVLLLAVLDADPALARRVGVRSDAVAGLLRTDAIGWEQPDFQPRVEEEQPAVQPSPPPVAPPVKGPVEAADRTAARVVDANLNRAREGLRVVEDYCRFVRDDRDRTEQVKALRHRLAAASSTLPTGVLLAARDTPGDVGTAVTAGAEYDRASPAEVAAVNLKRLQEALRSAEEFGKLIDPEFARAVEQVRYGAYELERSLFAGSDPRSRVAAARLYLLVTGDRCRLGLERTVAEATAGGVDVVQLREKGLPDRELLARARTVRRLTREAGVLFIVNDRPDIARLADADGVHLGQDDLPVTDARRVVGPDALIGVSTHTLDQVRRAVADRADYLGAGPTFPSRTKAFDDFPGLPFVGAASAGTSLPVFALGGIDSSTAGAVLAGGASRIAVSAAILDSDDPRHAAAELRQIVRQS